jgi:hypothetical protein
LILLARLGLCRMMAIRLGSVELVLVAKLLSVAGKHVLNDAKEMIWKKCNNISHEISHFQYGDWNLALQVGGVSDEIIKYGREFCGTSTQE